MFILVLSGSQKKTCSKTNFLHLRPAASENMVKKSYHFSSYSELRQLEDVFAGAVSLASPLTHQFPTLETTVKPELFCKGR